ncbi:MAG: hypothetical protein A4E73_03738 [Syntrophaceae bacterium PtaU1.Bin231]|nr:MAG: hypothetical protein A4E73_03738 [Syntrophaceae bacterium PtaU1.Bin231]HOG18107.1 DUF488 family protein [Syntrophales bacterium]
MEIRIKRVYEKPEKGDGRRILVDRLWPRGLRREDAKIDRWAKEISPSHELRKWYGHDPAKWDEFRRRYFTELAAEEEAVAQLRKEASAGTVTLLYSSKEGEINNAAALKRYLEARQK